MYLEGHFQTLLRDSVNLAQFRLDRLEDRVERIYAALCADETLGSSVVAITRQGSWAQGTIVNPRPDRDFDADFTLQLVEDDSWEPQDYLRAVRRTLKANAIYMSMTLERKNRCVRVVYKDGFHVDVVPAIERGNVEYIANYETNEWERTNPEGFTAWMQRKDAVAHANLRRSIRLMKWVRDHRGFTGVRSIILTTLLGEQIDAANEFATNGYYSDLSSTFTHLLTDLDAYIWANPSRPTIADPSGTGLTFDHRWTTETYDHFRQRLHSLAATANAAAAATDRDESERLWREIFGDKFTDSAGDSHRFGAPPESPAAGYATGRAG